jgi:hypothetical protein
MSEPIAGTSSKKAPTTSAAAFHPGDEQHPDPEPGSAARA